MYRVIVSYVFVMKRVWIVESGGGINVETDECDVVGSWGSRINEWRFVIDMSCCLLEYCVDWVVRQIRPRQRIWTEWGSDNVKKNNKINIICISIVIIIIVVVVVAVVVVILIIMMIMIILNNF